MQEMVCMVGVAKMRRILLHKINARNIYVLPGTTKGLGVTFQDVQKASHNFLVIYLT